MVTFRPGSHVSKLVTLLSFVGEYPFWSLDLLGSERVYKALIVKLTQPEHFVNSQTGAEMDCRLFNLTGKGVAKSVRLYKRALHILDWVHPDAYRYYMDSFWGHHFPGDDLHLDRHHRVAEAAAVCMRAGMELRPYVLPMLQDKAIQSVVLRTPSLYLARDIKRGSGPETSKTAFTRMMGAAFYPGGCYGVYNTRDAAMKRNGMGEVKTVYYLTELARLNAGCRRWTPPSFSGPLRKLPCSHSQRKARGSEKLCSQMRHISISTLFH